MSEGIERLIVVAGRAITDPICSLEDRKKAIEFLSTADHPNAVEALKAALQIRGRARDEQPNVQQRPIFGELAGQAARGLGRHPHSLGRKIMVDLIADPESAIEQKDLAIYGLAGCFDDQSLDALAHALKDPLDYLRHCAVFSLKESLDAFGDRHPTESAYHAINALLLHGLHYDFEPAKGENDGAQFARFVVMQHLTPAAVKLIEGVLLESKGSYQSTPAIEMLARIRPKGFEVLLGTVLLQKDHSRSVYEVIAESLRGSELPEVLEAADSILRESDYLGWIRKQLDPEKQVAYLARRTAASIIIQYASVLPKRR